MRTVEAEFVRTIATSRNLLEQTLPKQALRPSVVTRFRPKIREQTGFETSPFVNRTQAEMCFAAACQTKGANANGLEPPSSAESPYDGAIQPRSMCYRIEDDGAITRLGKSCDLQRTTWRTQVSSNPNRERLWALFRPGGLCRSAASPTRPGPRPSRPSQGPASERRERQVIEDGQIPRRNCAKSSECRFCR